MRFGCKMLRCQVNIPKLSRSRMNVCYVCYKLGSWWKPKVVSMSADITRSDVSRDILDKQLIIHVRSLMLEPCQNEIVAFVVSHLYTGECRAVDALLLTIAQMASIN